MATLRGHAGGFGLRQLNAIGAMLALLCWIAPAALVATNTAVADTLTLAEVEQNWDRLSNEQKFVTFDQILPLAQFDLAERLITRVKPATPSEADQVALFRGQILRGQGRHAEAAELFRELLAAKPQYARVRMELAITLAQMQEDDSARHHLELLLGGAASNPMFDQVVRSHINAIDSRKRWDFSTFLTLAPSTNLNQGSASTTININGVPFMLADKNVKKSGIGLSGGLQAGLRRPVAQDIDWLISGTAIGKLYRETAFNDAILSASTGPRYNFGRGYLGVYATTDRRWLGGERAWAPTDAMSRSWGGLLSTSLQVTPGDIVFADFACARRRFETDWQSVDLSYQDGHTCSLSARLDHHIDTRTYLRAIAGLGMEQTQRTALDNTSKSAGVGVYRELAGGLSVYLQGLYTRQEFNDIYSGFAVARTDNRLDISANLTKRDFQLFGFAPMLQYTYTLNRSTIPLHQFDAHGVNLTMTKRY